MGVAAKMQKICDNIRLRTGGTELLTLDDIAEAIMQIGEATDLATTVYRTIGTTYPPDQLPGESAFVGYDIDVPNAMSDDIYTYIDSVVSGKTTSTKEIMGKDASGLYDIVRYTYANRESIAWQRENYPKMYGWKNGSTVIYSTSVSPRIGDNMYTGSVIGEKYGAQTGTTTETVSVPAKAVLIRGYRYSHSGQKFQTQTSCAALVFPSNFESTSDSQVLTLSNATFHKSYTGCYIGDTNTAFPNSTTKTLSSSDTVATANAANSAANVGQKFGVVFLAWDNASTFANTTLTIDGVSIDIIVTDSTADSVKAAHATTEEVEVETEAVPATVTAVSAANRSRTINGLEFVRYESGDVEPTVMYTAVDDTRNSNASITQNGITYYRYPLGDLGANQSKLTPIFIYANEHGIEPSGLDETNSRYQMYETKMCALVAARFMRDLVSGAQANNPLYKFIRENCMVIVIPVANPWGYNLSVSGVTPPGDGRYGYLNSNGCNINRNYDCPGWDVMNPSGVYTETGCYIFGSYVGSENETQYVMNTMVESGAVVAISLHGLGGWHGYCAHQGQSPDGSDYDRDKLEKVNTFLQTNYGYTLRYYNLNSDGTPAVATNTPDITCKSPSYITQCGAYGGIVEFSPDDVNTSGWMQEMKSNVIENAYAQTLNLMAMWLSDYLEQ